MGNSHDWAQHLTVPQLTLGSTVTVCKTHSRTELTPVQVLERIQKLDVLSKDQLSTMAAAANNGLVEKHTKHIHFVLGANTMKVKRIDCWMTRINPQLLDVQITSACARVPFSKGQNLVTTRDGEFREQIAIPVGVTMQESERVSKLLSQCIEWVSTKQCSIVKNTTIMLETYSVPRTLATWKGASMDYTLDEKQKAALHPLYLWVHNSHQNWLLSFENNRQKAGFVWDWSLASSAPIGKAYKTQVKDSVGVHLYQAPSGGIYYRFSTDNDAKDPVFKTQKKSEKPWFWIPTKGPFVIVKWRSGELVEGPGVVAPVTNPPMDIYGGLFSSTIQNHNSFDTHLSLFLL